MIFFDNFILELIMKYRIALTEFPAFDALYENIDIAKDSFDFEFVKTDEINAAELLKTGKANLALLTPSALAGISKNGDWRIIPSTLLAAKGYSELFSIAFKQNLKSIDTIYFPNNSKHLSNITKILFAERFDIVLEFIYDATDKDRADAEFICKSDEQIEHNLDLCEDWFDTFEFPLPLAFWVAPAEIDDYSIVELTKKLRDELTPNLEVVQELTDNPNYDARNGEILWAWNEEIETSIDETIDLLYYHHLIDQIIDVKIFGRDYSHED